MKLLLLPAYFTPELVSDTPLDDARYCAFAEAGMEMELFTSVPTRGVSDEDKEKYSKIKNESMYNGKMSVHRFSMIDEGTNPILRALRYFLCFVKQYYYGRKQKGIGAIFVVSTPPIQGMLAGMLKKRLNCGYVYNLQDIFPDTLVGAGLAKKDGLLWKIGRKIENYTYKQADKIIVISEDFKRNIMAKGVPEEKIVVVYNWVDQNAIFPIKDEDNDLFEEFGISRDKFRVVYAGNLGNAQNIGIIVDAAKRLKENANIEFVIFGKGGLEDEIKATKEKDQLDNLKILPLQPYERVAKVYGLGNICIVACKVGLGGAAMPSKTWSIMSAGRAVLANFDEGELKEILENNECGVFTKADDLDGFIKAIEDLSQHPERCAEMGAKGREFILKNLTKDVGTQKYVDVIKSVVKDK